MTDDPAAPRQGELPLPAPPLPEDLPLIPARMVNEFVYCPRLAYLEWVQGEWAESADTVDGQRVHRRVDREQGDALAEAGEAEADQPIHARSVTLGSAALGVIARLDLIEGEGSRVSPVDYKRGKRPHTTSGAHEPERVQLCLQGLLLAEHGYDCSEGVLYFRDSRERVRVAFSPALRDSTLAAVHGLRLLVAGGHIPPPTSDSRKCPRCSLVGICLPDEVVMLGAGRREPDFAPRPLAVRAEEALPVYVQAGHGKIGKAGETLEIVVDDQPSTSVRLIDTSQLVIFGNVSLTTPCLHELLRRGIPVTWHSYGGWFLGHTIGLGHKNVELRTAQYRRSFDERFCLSFAAGLVAAKARNARTLLRRNWRGAADDPSLAQALEALRRAEQAAVRAPSLGSLLGVEGAAAAAYFGHFAGLLRPPEGEAGERFGFRFEQRNRRPPADPVNALLSFAYALLARTLSVTISAVGLDPYRGFYHQPRYGRPALALDLMEPYRPLLADSAVLMALNNGEIRPDDFVHAAGAVAMNPAARKALIAAFERRLSQELTHPLFGYVVSWRQALEIQVRLLGRQLTGEIESLPHLTPR